MRESFAPFVLTSIRAPFSSLLSFSSTLERAQPLDMWLHQQSIIIWTRSPLPLVSVVPKPLAFTLPSFFVHCRHGRFYCTEGIANVTSFISLFILVRAFVNGNYRTTMLWRPPLLLLSYKRVTREWSVAWK